MQDNLTFRKSTFSFANGNCIEVGKDWRRSHACDGGACLETASAPGAVLVRDTTDREGPVLRFHPEAWAAFTAAISAVAR